MNETGEPNILSKIAQKLPLKKLTRIQVGNITADLLGVVMFFLLVCSKSQGYLTFSGFIGWFVFVVWCFKRAFLK
jgi:hypothetical protein